MEQTAVVFGLISLVFVNVSNYLMSKRVDKIQEQLKKIADHKAKEHAKERASE